MKSPKLKIKVWKSRDGYRWNMTRCGRIVAESGEGYKRVSSCTNALCQILKCIAKLNYSWVDLKGIGIAK